MGLLWIWGEFLEAFGENLGGPSPTKTNICGVLGNIMLIKTLILADFSLFFDKMVNDKHMDFGLNNKYKYRFNNCSLNLLFSSMPETSKIVAFSQQNAYVYTISFFVFVKSYRR